MSRGSGRFARALVAAALVAAAATLLRGAAPAPVAAAQSGLSYTSVATWTVDPAMGRVHVALQVTATSHAAGTDGRRYFFSVNADALDYEPWRAGTVYLLHGAGFAEQPPMRLGDEWVRTQQVATATPVRPAAKLSVEPADFPLLASIRGHDTRMRVTR